MNKALVVLICITMIFSTEFSFADSSDDQKDKDVLTSGAEYEDTAEPYTPSYEEEQALKEKIKQSKEDLIKFLDMDYSYSFSDRIQGRTSIIVPIKPLVDLVKLQIPFFVQENGYYCGPATVKQIVHYKNGTSHPQSYYAKLLGTTKEGTFVPNLAPLLKKETGFNYTAEISPTFSVWKNRIISTIITQQMPCVIIVNTKGVKIDETQESWAYETSGHIIAVKGRANKGRSLVLSDTHNRYPNPNYIVSVELAYKANMQHFRKTLIW